MDTNNVFVSFDPSTGWNNSGQSFGTPSGTISAENPIEVTYTQETNTPVAITIKGQDWQQSYVKAGVEVVEKRSEGEEAGSPNIDEIEDEKIKEEDHYSEEDQEKDDLS
jgi:hypothetical protein